MITWEYLKLEGDADLAALGRQGWELVAVVPAAGGPPTCYLKRPAPDFRDQVTSEQKQRYYALLGRAPGEPATSGP